VDADSARISMAHGEGARLSRALISNIILPRLCRFDRRHLTDAATVTTWGNRLAICTDSHTVTPLFFPGGDLGTLSVYGTVNDLVVAGATPRWLTLSLILEEGLPIAVLEAILDRAALAADRCGVEIVAGDTKVVPRGAADGIFINTTGIGELAGLELRGPAGISLGDQILVSGPIGCHGIAVLAARESLGFDPAPESDLKPLIESVNALRNAGGLGVKAVRDATRGGVSAVLHEWAADCGLTFELDESAIPVTDAVRGACELLGLEPLTIANEGTFLTAVSPEEAELAIQVLRRLEGHEQARVIGTVCERTLSDVVLKRGHVRVPVDEPAGVLLPRIC
jgi:hydrogenase expression/formation protein HypE